MTLKESLEKFIPPVYTRTKRSKDTYTTVAAHCRNHLTDLVQKYRATQNDQQLLREIRNDMDYYLRRYHEYCIEQRDNMGAHYHEVGADEQTDFEHLIPASRIRDLLIKQVITVDQALNAPTVVLSRSKHVQLKDAGWASKTPDMWHPFKRYTQVFDAKYTTHDGTAIDPNTWTLEDHFNYFSHLVV